MKYTNLGKTGVKVSELCLGTMIYGEDNYVDEANAIKIIRRAIDLGVNFIDTADVYTQGRSEEIVGKAIKGQRDAIVLATKVRGRTGPGPNDMGLSRKHILQNIEASLRRLGTDYIDLYQVHNVDPTTPLEETLTTLNDLVRDGTVRYVGCSNFPAWLLEKALWISDVNGLEPFVTAQCLYNIIDRDVEHELLPLCTEEDIGIITYSPLARGFLTGKYQSDKPAPKGSRGQFRPQFIDGYFTPRGQTIVDELTKLSAKTKMSMCQLSLAWLMANPVVTSPIVGISKLEHLEENVEAVDYTLPDDVRRQISDVSKPDWLRKREEHVARVRGWQRKREERVD